MEEKKKSILLLTFLRLLPKNLSSRLFGMTATLRLPPFLLQRLLRTYVRKYGVDLSESARKPEDFNSLSAFFTRALKEGKRPVDQSRDAVVSPVDATVSSLGPIDDLRMIQVKGVDFTLSALLRDQRRIRQFRNGSYIVLYLSPRDYHRIHSPCAGRIAEAAYFPGKLFPVNEVAVHGLRELYSRNERLITYLETEHGTVAVVKVGALNVGRIRVTYDDIVTNRWLRRPERREYGRTRSIARGAELGVFELGSTVVLLFEKNAFHFRRGVVQGAMVRFGEAIGKFAGNRRIAEAAAEGTRGKNRIQEGNRKKLRREQ